MLQYRPSDFLIATYLAPSAFGLRLASLASRFEQRSQGPLEMTLQREIIEGEFAKKDTNLLHRDAQFAQELGRSIGLSFPDIVGHGIIGSAMASQVSLEQYGGLSSELVHLGSVRYNGASHPGDVLIADVNKISEDNEIEFIVGKKGGPEIIKGQGTLGQRSSYLFNALVSIPAADRPFIELLYDQLGSKKITPRVSEGTRYLTVYREQARPDFSNRSIQKIRAGYETNEPINILSAILGGEWPGHGTILTHLSDATFFGESCYSTRLYPWDLKLPVHAFFTVDSASEKSKNRKFAEMTVALYDLHAYPLIFKLFSGKVGTLHAADRQ